MKKTDSIFLRREERGGGIIINVVFLMKWKYFRKFNRNWLNSQIVECGPLEMKIKREKTYMRCFYFIKADFTHTQIPFFCTLKWSFKCIWILRLKYNIPSNSKTHFLFVSSSIFLYFSFLLCSINASNQFCVL